MSSSETLNSESDTIVSSSDFSPVASSRRFHSREIIVRTDDVVDEAAGEPDVEGYVAAHEGIIDRLRYRKGQQCGHPDRQGSDKAVPRPTERPLIFLIIIVFDLHDELL